MQKVRAKKILQICALLIAFAIAFTAIAVNVDDVYAAAKTPAKVKSLKLTEKTKTSLNLKWASVKNAKKYQVAYKKAGAKKFVIVKSTKVKRTLSNLKSGTKYKVKVRAVNGKKYGKWSATKTFKTKAAKKPAQVKSVLLSSATSSTLNVKWSKAKNSTKYEVAYKKVGAKKYTTVTTTKVTRTIKKLKTDTAYYVRVRGVDGSNKGKWSATKKFRTPVNYSKASNESKVKVSVTDEKIKIQIASLGMNGKATLYRVSPNQYLAADDISGIVSKNVKGTKVGTFMMNKKKTFSIPRVDANGYDKMYDKYYVVYNGNIIKGPVYATSINSLRKDVIKDTETKKGLIDELTEESFDLVEDTGSQWTGMNIDFTALVLANEDENGKPIDNSNKNADTIEVNGKTFYINSSYVSDLDYRLGRYEKMGVNVVGILISFVSSEGQNNYPRALKYIDDARWTNGFNTSTDAGRDYFIAGMEYLANRYSKGGKGLISNYVIGNEVDYAYDWYEVIPNESVNGKKLPPRGSKYLRDGEIETTVPLDVFMEEYSRTLRLANMAVKKYADDVTVSISLSKEWSKSKGEQQNANPTTNKRCDSYRPMEMMDWLNYYTKKGGDFDWAVTQHHYSLVDGNASAYQTGLTSDTVYINGDPDTTLMITQSNMEVLQLYLNRTANKYNGKARAIHLTENGSSSGSDIGTHSIAMQKEQAAAVAQHYYRAASLPSVKSIIYYKINDREEEGSTSYKMGLKDTNGNKKLAYEVWKYIDTDRSFEIANKYLDSISFKKNGKEYSKRMGNIKSYYDVMETVKSKFDWSKHWNEDALTPIKLNESAVEASLITDKTEYGADDPILVTATGADSDKVGLYKRGEDIQSEPIYYYSVGERNNGIKHKSGKTYDIRAYGAVSENRREDAKLPAGEYSIILSSGAEEVLRIDITITGTSAFEGKKMIATNKTTYKYGEDILVTASGSGKDWVGIYKEGEKAVPASSGGVESIYWYYVDADSHVSGKPAIIQKGSKNANSSNPQSILQPGKYYVILLANDGYEEIARVSGITIEGGDIEKLQSISYQLDNATDGFANGTVTVTKSENSDATDCLMYWADANGTPLEGYTALAKFKLTGNTTEERMQANTIIPPDAKTLVAYAGYGGEWSKEAVVTVLPEGAAYQYEPDSAEITRFAVASDLHLVTEGNGNDYGLNTNHHFELALRDIVKNLPGAEAFMLNGDIADHGKAAEFKTAMNILQSVKGAPTLHMAIGNHDWRTGNPDGQFQKYANWFNPAVDVEEVYYDEWIDGYHHIYLGSEEPGEVAILSDAQLKWFDNLLEEDSEKDQTKPVFVYLHEGLSDSMAGNYAGQWGYSNGVAQESKLKKILQKYGQIVMFGGHTHYDLNTDNSLTPGSDELPVSINTSSIGYLWDAYNSAAGEYLEGGQGYFVKVFDDKIYMFGRDFLTGEYIPSAMFVIQQAKLTVDKEKLSMYVGDDNINLGVKTEDGMQVTYKSSNSKVASVDYRGNVRAIGKGKAKIYISTESSDTKCINRKIVTVTVE